MTGRIFLFVGILTLSLFPYAAGALRAAGCLAQDRACILKEIETESAQIENTSWRDQTYRELAKTKAADGDMDGAIALIDKIETPDTQAMTIRGIGMAAADLKLEKAAYDALFTKLRTRAEKIEHPPSYAIALTYIAMAQAFAGDNEGAWKTASEMENDALRHKAYGETAEIQAEVGNAHAAMKSIGFIDSIAFRNKAYAIVSKILADRKDFDGAMAAAMTITNPYKKAKALQYILDVQKPREVEKKY
ncbi:MAG TPA: hypothetical protein PK513_03710 [Alphaproteobacteria bacterium]|nr:hypothetical protein [Alphaproteobacteria bacterium]USO06370.1 MAG: hypothetical protein H6859_04065 [Rhodospirillales bacterium]HOO81589.1 hypothetical protein [Alphaproteobacteria bacterium]